MDQVKKIVWRGIKSLVPAQSRRGKGSLLINRPNTEGNKKSYSLFTRLGRWHSQRLVGSLSCSLFIRLIAVRTLPLHLIMISVATRLKLILTHPSASLRSPAQALPRDC